MRRHTVRAEVYYEVEVAPDEYVEHTAHVEYQCSPYDPGRSVGPPERCYPPEGGVPEVVNGSAIRIDHGEERGAETIDEDELLQRIARDYGSTPDEAREWLEEQLEEHYQGELEAELYDAAEARFDYLKDEGLLP